MYNNEFMLLAIQEAEKALNENEIPVGAVIVKDEKVISMFHNTCENTKNAINHAEILSINNACEVLKSERLNDCDMYVTLEPCPMCAGAILNARIKNLFFGAYDEKYGSCGSLINVLTLSNNYNPSIKGGYLKNECEELIKNFFKKLR